jgi:sucrose-6-phosphatase
VKRILLCSDLDRTLLPNGTQAESPQARSKLRCLAQRPEITLVYVSGRHRTLMQSAIRDYDIPLPDYAIGDVGTTIYEVCDNDTWRLWKEWNEEIGQDWQGKSPRDLALLFTDIKALRPQEPEKQNQFKLSFYAPPDVDRDRLISILEQRLYDEGVLATLIWSVDETVPIGLLDVLPKRANKLHAICFLMERKHFPKDRTVFAGDSGNDLEVLTSGLQAILVRNAQDEVREEALRRLPEKDRKQLYCARGSFMGLNGYYSAGVLEGLAHFFPETRAWMEENREGIASHEALTQPCAIYRSQKKTGSYLYVENEDDFSQVPTKLLEMLGELEFVMRLELHSGTPLAQAEVHEVMNLLRENGYFLQLSSREYKCFP